MPRCGARYVPLPSAPSEWLTFQRRNAYRYHGCRCDECRAGWAEWQRNLRAQRAESVARRTDLPHGTRSTYVNHGCRCDACYQAQSEANRRAA